MILVSGFKPFLNEKINPSEMLVKKLVEEYSSPGLHTVILAVEFEKSFVQLKAEIEKYNPEYIVMFGQAAGRQKINLEKIGLNWNQTLSPDESGFTPAVGSIYVGKELAYMSKFPIDELFHFLEKEKVEATISFSAGTYVCNNLYYKVLEAFPNKKSLFVHVPLLPEQGLPQQPKMDFDHMLLAATKIIEFLRLA